MRSGHGDCGLCKLLGAAARHNLWLYLIYNTLKGSLHSQTLHSLRPILSRPADLPLDFFEFILLYAYFRYFDFRLVGRERLTHDRLLRVLFTSYESFNDQYLADPLGLSVHPAKACGPSSARSLSCCRFMGQGRFRLEPRQCSPLSVSFSSFRHRGTQALC